MNDILFREQFRFNEFCFIENVHRDNTKGVPCHSIGFMKHGKGILVSKGKRIEVRENDMFYIPKGCSYHSYWITEEQNVRFHAIGFFHFPTIAPNGYELQKIDYDQQILHAFLPLSKDKTVHAASIGHLYHLLGLLEKILQAAPVNKENAVLDQFMMLLHQNPHLSITEYATLCGISESLLYGCIKKAVHITPNRLRQEVICENAIELLTTTNLTVEEICDQIHLSSASYFRKLLSSIHQKTPSQIRKEANMI